MELLLLLAAGAAAHQYLKEPDIVIPPSEHKVMVQNEQVFVPNDTTLAMIDWSKAGNFRQTSSTNNVEWVIISE
jgi:hypothetical protein